MTFLRYSIVQILAYAIDMGIFILLINTPLIDPIGVNILSKISAGIFAFIVQRKFTFKVAAKELVKMQAIRYFIVLIFNIPIASVILILMLYLIADPVLAKFLSDIVCVNLSYMLGKYFIFPRNPRSYNPPILTSKK
jgi:putative flippase GtrA